MSVSASVAMASAPLAVKTPVDARQVIIQVAPGTSAAEVQALAASEQATLVGSFMRPGSGKAARLFCLRSDRSAASLAAELSADPEVVRAAPDARITADVTYPKDPMYQSLWGLYVIDLPLAWDITTGLSSAVVAVIDSGVDYNHEDLAANMWRNPGEIAGNGVDDDGNGYVDDIYGIDAYNHDSDPADDGNHGTAVAGIAGAVGSNQIGLTGAAWNVKIMALKALGSSLVGSNSSALECVDYAIRAKTQYGVNVVAINASWGGAAYPEDPYLKQAIEAAGRAGIIWCASSGNEGRDNDAIPRFPSSYDIPTILSVASSTSADQLSTWGNIGATSVDLAAPGENIKCLKPANQYAWMSGTSMSAPDVAGVVALCASLRPTETALQRVDRVLSSVEQIPAAQGKVRTGGRLNAFNALVADLRPATSVTGLSDGWATAPATAAFSASDGTGIGIDHTEYSLDGAAYQPGSRVTVGEDGVHTLLYRSVDRAANAEVAKSVSVKVDITPPELGASGAGDDWHSGPVTVHLTATDATSGLAGLEYGLDGAELATAPSQVADVAVAVEGSHVVRAKAADVAGNSTGLQSFSARIDSLAPDVSATGADELWHDRAVTVHLSATDPNPPDSSGVEAIEYSETGDDWTTIPGAAADVVVPAAGNDGTHNFAYRALDAAGNVSVAGAFEVKIGTSASLRVSGADDAWHAGPVEVRLDGDAVSGIEHVEYRLSGDDDWTVVEGPSAVLTVAEEGVSTYEARARSFSGATSPAQAFTVKVDTASPRVAALDADGVWHAADVTVHLSATDPGSSRASGVASMEYREGDGQWKKVDGDVTDVLVPAAGNDGVHAFAYRAIDLAGNVSAEGGFTVLIDVSAPTAVATGADGAWHATSVTVHLSATDPAAPASSGVASIQYREDTGSAWTTVLGSSADVVVPAAGHDGSHTYLYRAADTAGTVSAASSFTVKMDTSAPAVTVTGADGLWRRTAVAVGISAADPGAPQTSGTAYIEYRQGSTGAWTIAGGSAATVFVSAIANDGAHAYQYRATDAAGNVSSVGGFTVLIDATAPVSTLFGADGLWHRTPVSLSLSSTDGAGSGVVRGTYSLDGATWIQASSFSISAQGTSTVRYRAEDLAGNVEATRSVAIKIDSVLPTTTAFSTSVVRNRTATLSYRVDDATPSCGQAVITGILIKTTGGTTVKTFSPNMTVAVNRALSHSFVCTLTAGTYRVTVQARDIAGNIATKLTVGTLTVKK